ncbi:hypothetical protein MYX07_06985 [Patescibacteria group bacterium AH-259-L07]|nr:hypothetical protein [Patescibacteria group bacterium AH-259-L07]
MAKVVFTNKNKRLTAKGKTHVSPGQIYYRGTNLEEVVDKLSYVPFFLHCLLSKNGSPPQIHTLEHILTRNIDNLISTTELERIARISGGSYHTISALVNAVGAKYEAGEQEKRRKTLNILHKELGLDDEIDPTMASAFIILNVLPKLYAVIDKREPYHNAQTFIESFFINALGKDPGALDEKELIAWDTYLVSLCTHGLTSPSYHGFRVTANACGSFTTSLQAWLAIANADLHFGAIGGAIKDLHEVERRGITHTKHIQEILDRGLRVKGYGHRVHPRLLANYPHSTGTIEDHQSIEYSEDIQTDPRVRINFVLWNTLGYNGVYTTMVRERAKQAFTLVGCANVDTMAAGLYLDLGLSYERTLVGPFISRIPHLTEIYVRETTQMRPNKYIGLEERT